MIKTGSGHLLRADFVVFLTLTPFQSPHIPRCLRALKSDVTVLAQTAANSESKLILGVWQERAKEQCVSNLPPRPQRPGSLTQQWATFRLAQQPALEEYNKWVTFHLLQLGQRQSYCIRAMWAPCGEHSSLCPIQPRRLYFCLVVQMAVFVKNKQNPIENKPSHLFKKRTNYFSIMIWEGNSFY